MIFCEKILIKIKASLHQNVEKSTSRKRYLYLFVHIGVFISVIKLPRIPTYLINMLKVEAGKMHPAGSCAAWQNEQTLPAARQIKRSQQSHLPASFSQSPSQTTSFSVKLSVDITIISINGLIALAAVAVQ